MCAVVGGYRGGEAENKGRVTHSAFARPTVTVFWIFPLLGRNIENEPVINADITAHSVRRPYRCPSTRHWDRNQEELEMDALKRFSFATVAVLLAAGVAPLLAQETRDTRPQPQRPVIESSDGGSSATEREPAPRLPKPTDGVRCLVKQGHGGPELLAVNGTGKVIPSGTLVTLYLQPGNIQKLFKLETDWQPGQSIGIPVKLADLPEGADCAVKLADGAPEQQPVANDPGTPSGGGEDEPDYSSEQLPGHRDPSIVDEVSCTVFGSAQPGYNYLVFTNTGTSTLPAGTKVAINMPDGSVYTYEVGAPYVPGGDWGIDGLFPDGIPEGWTCTFELILPEPNP